MLRSILTLCFLTFSMLSHSQTIVIHGGAGWITQGRYTIEEEDEYGRTLQAALDVGYEIMQKGGSSIEAVEASIRLMEDSPVFNSGKGAVYNSKGKYELDASIMDGKSLQAGAVAGLQSTRHPISAAKAVMEQTKHVLLAGKAADKWAHSIGLVSVPNKYFSTPERVASFKKHKKESRKKAKMKAAEASTFPPAHQPDFQPDNKSLDYLKEEAKFGTVGCVALDLDGNLAAGTSTGGMSLKKYGRVGDSPIIGAGTFANNRTCAVSCTGHGEYFIRLGIAQHVSELMDLAGYSVYMAADESINKLLTNAGGRGGLIALDDQGNFAMPFNTPGMFRAHRNEKGSEVLMYK